MFKDKDGDVYEGEFSNGMINGKGRLINATEKRFYFGNWKNN